MQLFLTKRGAIMRKPRPPKNLAYWISVAENDEQVKEFEENGNDRQKRCLKQAQKVLKWRKLQRKKG